MGAKVNHAPGPWIVLFDTGTFTVYDTKEDADTGLAHGIRETAGNVSGAVLPLGLMRAAPALLTALEHARARLVHTHGVNPNDALHSEIDAAIARATGGAR